MASSPPGKIVLKSTTNMSLNDRFSAIRKQGTNATGRRGSLMPNNQASAKNRRLAQQMENRPSVIAALKLKRNLKLRLGQQNTVKTRLSLRGAAGRFMRGAGIQRGNVRGIRGSRLRGILKRGSPQLGYGMVNDRGNNFKVPRGAGMSPLVKARLGSQGRGGMSNRRGMRGNRGVRFMEGGGPIRGGFGANNFSNRRNFRGQQGRGNRGGRFINMSASNRGARGRGGAFGSSKQELDTELDEYMAKTKSYLDAEIDAYMAEAVD